MAKLCNEQKEFIRMNLELGISNVELARRFGVSEGTIRYHRKRKKKEDGRENRFSEVSKFNPVIETWVESILSSNSHRPTIHSLYRSLRDFHEFNRSYDALRRYIKKHYPKVFEKTYYLRVETPPGKLAQVDWKERVNVQMNEPGNWVSVNFLILLLSFSRKPAIIVREKMNQEAFLSAHHDALKEIGGTTEYIRSDCMKTAVKIWNGRKSEMNIDYQEFLDKIGTKAFPSRPGMPTDKGKVEKKIQDIFRDIDFRRIIFQDMAHLQSFIDEKVEAFCQRTICPVTGTTISKAYKYERTLLEKSVQIMPDIPVETSISTVQKGNLVWFKGNYYQIPEGYLGKSVRCINSGTLISIYYQGQILESFKYLPGVKGMTRMSSQAALKSECHISDQTREWWLEVAEMQPDYCQNVNVIGDFK